MQGPAVTVDIAATFQPYDRQARWLASDALFRLFLGGVGSGKSWSLTLWCVLQQLANPGVEGALLGRTTNDLINPLLPEYFGHLQKLQDATGVSYITDYNKGQGYVDLLGGGRCWFRPYNRIAKIRGISIGWAACDEIEWSEADPEEVWTVLTGRMRIPCPRPGLAFATSPNGLRGITKRFVDCQREYRDALKTGDTEAAQRLGRYYTTVSTSYDNPHLPDYYFDALRSMSRRRYKQEVEGKVLRPLNNVWQLEARHLVPWQWQQHRHLDRVYGIDWGGQDHHVAVMCQVTSSGAWVVADELVCDDMPRGHFHDRVSHWISAHGPADPALIAADRAAPVENQLLQQRWRKTQVRWMESKDQQKVEHGIEIVRDMMDPCDGDPTLQFSTSLAQSFSGVTAPIVPAMRGYCYLISHDGVQLKPKKDNTHDHSCDALRYIVAAAAHDPKLHGGRTLWRGAAGPKVRAGDSYGQRPGHSSRQVL